MKEICCYITDFLSIFRQAGFLSLYLFAWLFFFLLPNLSFGSIPWRVCPPMVIKVFFSQIFIQNFADFLSTNIPEWRACWWRWTPSRTKFGTSSATPWSWNTRRNRFYPRPSSSLVIFIGEHLTLNFDPRLWS